MDLTRLTRQPNESLPENPKTTKKTFPFASYALFRGYKILSEMLPPSVFIRG